MGVGEGSGGGGGGGEGLETSAAQTNRWSGLDGRGQLITPQVVTASPLRFAGQQTSYRGCAGSTRHRGGRYRSASSWLPSLFLPLFIKRQQRQQKNERKRKKKIFLYNTLKKGWVGCGAFKIYYAIAPQNYTTLHLYHRIYSWSRLTRPSVPEMKYRSSTGENSSRPERVEHMHFFFLSAVSKSRRTARLAREPSSPQSHLGLAFMQIIALHHKRREEVGHERVCCSKKEKENAAKRDLQKNMKACVHL